MKKLLLLLVTSNLFLTSNTKAQTCGTVYGAGYNGGATSSIGVREYNFATNTYSPASLINTALFVAPNTMNNGGPISIDPLDQRINFVTDNTAPRTVALFTLGASSLTLVSFPAALNSAVTGFILCSGYKPLSHQSYYMTQNYLSTSPTPAGTTFFRIDFTNTAAPTYQIYNGVLAPGSPAIVTSTGGDLCFDANDIGYLITSSKQLYRINPDDASGIATFSYIAQLDALTFTPTAVAFNPTNSALVITGDTPIVSEYNLATNVITVLTNTAGYSAPDLASCFYPNVAPALNITKSYFDVTKNQAPPVVVATNDIVEYTITIKNTGSVNAGGFTLTDAIPAGTTYQAGTTTLNGTAVTDGAGGTFPYQTTKAASSNDQATANGILTTNTTVGAPVCVIKYKVQVTATCCAINNVATASVLGVDPIVPLSATTNVQFYANGLLPIKLLSFDAQKVNNTAELKWAMDNNSTDDYIEIEYSENGKNFTKIDRVNSFHSASAAQYNFTDDKIKSTIHFYRLKMVDVNGQITYSDIRRVVMDKTKNTEVNIFPNPAKKQQQIFVQINTNYKKVIVQVLNIAGALVQQKEFTNSNNAIFIDTEKLAVGTYIVETIVDGVKLKQKMVVIL